MPKTLELTPEELLELEALQAIQQRYPPTHWKWITASRKMHEILGPKGLGKDACGRN